jgi:hypothetical protein
MAYPARRIASRDAAAFLGKTYRWPLDRCIRVLEIARQVRPGSKAEPTEGGYALVTATGSGHYTVEDHTGRETI